MKNHGTTDKWARGRLGEMLLEKGLITEKQLGAALERKLRTGRFLGEVLIEMGLISPEVLGRTLKQMIGVPYVDLLSVPIEPEALARIPEEYQRQHRVLPFHLEMGQLFVAMRDPVDIMVIDDMHILTGLKIVPHSCFNRELEAAFNRVHPLKKTVTTVLEGLRDLQRAPARGEPTIDELLHLAEDAPIVRVVHSILSAATAAEASDIHIEPKEKFARVRYRVDGILSDQTVVPGQFLPAVISRIKILAGMDISERRRPQDGRFTYASDTGRMYHVRVSVVPMLHGEKAVLRLLDQSGLMTSLDLLGLFPEQLERFEALIRHPYGIVLVTGPTGSGKSTTLYAALNSVANDALNINTIEDPIEYELESANQEQVNPKIGVTFAWGLRALLRQDPDIIMVGEIRDQETALIAAQAALTGHLVFSTVHTNGAVEALTRLQNIGVEPYLLSAGIVGIAGQRLARRVCRKCAVADTPDPITLRVLNVNAAQLAGGTLLRGQGCEECGGSGYRGRVGLFEVLPLSAHLREALVDGASAEFLHQIAIQEGMTTMFESGLRRALQGETTLAEVARVLVAAHLADKRLDSLQSHSA
ncbi:MAG TPA: GspE/PulE family protein [Chthonomonadaceae bacterium]|nr:GspE/PulE family protein [Chthonomonadaceae bacterium]